MADAVAPGSHSRPTMRRSVVSIVEALSRGRSLFELADLPLGWIAGATVVVALGGRRAQRAPLARTSSQLGYALS